MLPNLPSYAQPTAVQPMNPSISAQNIASSMGRRQLVASKSQPFDQKSQPFGQEMKKTTVLSQKSVDLSKTGVNLQKQMLNELKELKSLNKKMMMSAAKSATQFNNQKGRSLFDKAQTFAKTRKEESKQGGASLKEKLGGFARKKGRQLFEKGKEGAKELGASLGKAGLGIAGGLGAVAGAPSLLRGMVDDEFFGKDPNAEAKAAAISQGKTTSFVEDQGSPQGSQQSGIFQTLKNIDKNLKQNFLLQNPFEKLRTILMTGTNVVEEGFNKLEEGYDSVKDKIKEVGAPIAKNLKDQVLSGAESAGNLIDTAKQKGGELFRSLKEQVAGSLLTPGGRQKAMSQDKTEGRDIRQKSQNGAISGAPRATRVLNPEERDTMLQKEIDASRSDEMLYGGLAERHADGRKREDIPEGERDQYDDAVRAQENAKKRMSQYQKLQTAVKDKGPMPEFREGGFKYKLEDKFGFDDGKGFSLKQNKGILFEDGIPGITEAGMKEDKSMIKTTFGDGTPDEGGKVKSGYRIPEMDLQTGLQPEFQRKGGRKAEETTGEKFKNFVSNLFGSSESKKVSDTSPGSSRREIISERRKEFQEKYGNLPDGKHTFKEGKLVSSDSRKEDIKERKKEIQEKYGNLPDGKHTFKEGKLVSSDSSKGNIFRDGIKSMLEKPDVATSDTEYRKNELDELIKFKEREGITGDRISGEQYSKFVRQQEKRNSLLSDTVENEILKENKQQGQSAPVVVNNVSKSEKTTFTPLATDPRPRNNSFERKIDSVFSSDF